MIEEFNVDANAEYTTLSSTRSQKKNYKKEETKTNKRQHKIIMSVDS